MGRLSLFSLLAFTLSAEALRFNAERRLLPHSPLRRLQRRDDEIAVGNQNDLIYSAKITVGGIERAVNIDTGSSDLWIVGNANDFEDTHASAQVEYAIGAVEGNIMLADVTFGGHTVKQQAYINATASSDLGALNGLGGLVGLGPFTGSVIRGQINSDAADPLLDRIFASDKSTPNFLSFTLSRSEDPTEPFEATFTIGEIVEGLEKITSEPKLVAPSVTARGTTQLHWTVHVDSVIGPDGKEIPYETAVKSESKPVAVVDTGFSLPQIPRAISDAIYGRVPNVVYMADSKLWVLPCEQELNISFVIGGQTYPIHPLDTNQMVTFTDGSKSCVGAFQGTDDTFDGQLDMILGDSFLRNTYTLIDFGNFTDVNITDNANPFIQFLSLTDTAQAHQDFVQARLNGMDTTGDTKYALLPASEQKKSPSTPGAQNLNFGEAKEKLKEGLNKTKKILIIVGAVLGGLVLLGLLLCILSCCGALGGLLVCFSSICCCCCRGRDRYHTKEIYRPLNAPAPMSHPQEYGFKGHGSYHNA